MLAAGHFEREKPSIEQTPSLKNVGTLLHVVKWECVTTEPQNGFYSAEYAILGN